MVVIKHEQSVLTLVPGDEGEHVGLVRPPVLVHHGYQQGVGAAPGARMLVKYKVGYK